MPAPHFAVETISSTLAVLSLEPEFSAAVIQIGASHSLEINSYQPADLDPLPTVDSWLIFLTPELATYFLNQGRGVWSQLTTYPHPHLYVVERAWQQVPLALPDHSTKIILGEYLGLGDNGNPTLKNIITAIKNSQLVNLAGGGLSSYHLMSKDYLINTLLTFIESNILAPTIHLYSPSSISLSALTQHLVSLSPGSRLGYIKGGIEALIPDSFYNTSHELLTHSSSPDTLDLATTELKNTKVEVISLPTKDPDQQHSPQLKTPSKPTLTPLQKTEKTSIPKNISSLEFVPKQSPHPRIKFQTLKNKLSPSKKLRIIAKGVVFGLIIYFGSIAFSLGILFTTLKHSLSTLNNQAIPNPPSKIAITTAKYLYTNAVALGLDNYAQLLDDYMSLQDISSTVSSLANSLGGIADYILTNQDLDFAADLSQSRLDIETLYQQLSLLDGSLPSTTPASLSRYDEQYQTLKNILPTLKKQTLMAKGVASILPDIIQIEDRVKYLVLFQNNMEVRGTGGFIGSYGILSFEKGKLYDFQVYDVYAADGQLKGHVEPPDPIKDILGEANWYLRDSNFDPDFPTSARRAEWFLKKSMNLDVNGTIALNLNTLKGLLKATGPLELPDYQEAVTSENLTEKAQYHAEVNFFPGSTAKKEFLSSVADALFARLNQLDQSSIIKLLISLNSSLESSDTQISTLSPSTELILQTLGWSGVIENQPCPTSPCYDDYFYPVDSNFGVNKANFYLKKNTSLNVLFDKDGIPTNTLSTTYQNQATSNAWPAGTYKNYQRTYLPPNAQIQSIQLGDTKLDPKDYQISQEHGKTVVSYLLTVPIKSSLTSVLVYKIPTSLKQSYLYSLYYQRQSGINLDDPLDITIEYPNYLKPVKISPSPVSQQNQKLSFSFDTNSDHRVSIQF